MTAITWYAASVILAIVNERGGLWRRVLSVVIVQATDFDDAFDKACQIGHGMEESYFNGDGELVRWAFERIETLDELPAELRSGTEIYSEPRPIENSTEISIETKFRPERFVPGQSGV